jgi:L-seryl-tRNA(Ser) seleniumtransferase
MASSVNPANSAVGGGAFPGAQVPTYVVSIQATDSPTHMDARLRGLDIPVVARIIDQQIAIDLRTVDSSDEPLLLDALLNAANA